MIRLIQFRIKRRWHLHKWKVIHKHNLIDDSGNSWDCTVCCCEICGEHRNFDYPTCQAGLG